jgi:hypothetical protein
MTTSREKNIAFATLNSYVIYVGGRRPPRDDEWIELFDFVEQSGMTDGVARRCLTISEGGSPSLAQQKIMFERIHRTLEMAPGYIKVAIVTPSTFARGVGLALSLLSPSFKVFRPDEMAQAYAYLGITPAFAGEIERIVQSLRATLTP